MSERFDCSDAWRPARFPIWRMSSPAPLDRTPETGMAESPKVLRQKIKPALTYPKLAALRPVLLCSIFLRADPMPLFLDVPSPVLRRARAKTASTKALRAVRAMRKIRASTGKVMPFVSPSAASCLIWGNWPRLMPELSEQTAIDRRPAGAAAPSCA